MIAPSSAARRDKAAVAVFGIVVVYLPFTLLGYGTDIDVANVLRAGGTFIRDGRYDISRHPGAPVHEIATGALDWIGGSVAINLVGVAFAALALGSLVGLARDDGARRPVWAALLLASNPWFWLAATSLGDFVWALALGAAGAAVARRDRRWLAGILFGLAMGCRLSSVLFPLSWLVAERLGDRSERPPWRATVTTAMTAAVVACVALLPAWFDAGRSLEFFGHQPPYPGIRINFGRWMVKNAAVIGLPAGVVLLAGARRGLKALRRWPASLSVRFGVLVIVTSELLFLRYPLKPVHLLPVIFGLAVLVGASRSAKHGWAVALVAAQLFTAVVGTTIAEPDVPHHARSGKVVVRLSEGVLLNDVRCRLDDRRDGPWPDATDPRGLPGASSRAAILFDCQSVTWKVLP